MELALPRHIFLDTALQINSNGLLLDGIELIGDDGTVWFEQTCMQPFQTILGYSCRSMPLQETEERARELHARFQAVGKV